MQKNTFRLITEIEFQTEEERDIFLASNKIHNAIKSYIYDLNQHVKYEEDENARHYLNILAKHLDDNNVLDIFE